MPEITLENVKLRRVLSRDMSRVVPEQIREFQLVRESIFRRSSSMGRDSEERVGFNFYSFSDVCY